MRYSTPLFALIGAAAGLGVATTGYQLASAPLPPVADPAEPMAAVGKPLPAAPAEVRTRLAPCTPPAHLQHGVCVTEEWRTTVVYDAPAPPAQPPITTSQDGAGPARPARDVAADAGDDAGSEDAGDAEDVEDHAGEDTEDHADEPKVDD
jgi:hypothetical protein